MKFFDIPLRQERFIKIFLVCSGFFYFRCGLHIAKIRFLEDQQRRGMTHYVTVRRKKSQK